MGTNALLSWPICSKSQRHSWRRSAPDVSKRGSARAELRSVVSVDEPRGGLAATGRRGGGGGAGTLSGDSFFYSGSGFDLDEDGDVDVGFIDTVIGGDSDTGLLDSLGDLFS